MGNKDSRSGGKFSGNHTTLSPLAAQICDIAHNCEYVTVISPGFIKAGIRSANGNRRIKITDKNGAVLLGIRDNTSHQEVYVFTCDLQETKLYLAKKCRDMKIDISFN